MSKPSYSPEFKRKVVEEHLKGGKSKTAICREYNVGEVAFRRWREQYQAAGNAAAQGQADLARELAAAQKRIDELEGAMRATTAPTTRQRTIVSSHSRGRTVRARESPAEN